MYDTMRTVINGSQSAQAISWAWQQTDDIRDHMLYFLENHDEQRIASDFFAADAHKGIPAFVASVLMQQNPFMLYAGQEYGERGMDSEGFSGNDGRTTIFDYWSIDTLCRAAKKQLTDDEKAIFHIYKKTLQMARREDAVINGVFFDLMYVNQHLSRQYVFLRRAGSDLLLVAVNFDGNDADISVNIPTHAFDYLQLKERKGVAHDLLSSEKMSLQLKSDSAVNMNIGAYGARVWKMKA